MNILFIGLGRMGGGMANHLIKMGRSVIGYHRRADKLEQWLNQHPEAKVLWDGEEKDIPKTVKREQLLNWTQTLAQIDTIITCVGADDDLRTLAFGQPAIAKNANPGTIWIDHTTTSAEVVRTLSASLAKRDIAFVDAPVSGGEAGAINGTLTMLAGADSEATYQRALEIAQPYLKQSSYMGGSGKGQEAKMVNQIALAGVLQGLAEAVYFAEQHQLPIEKLATAMGGGAAQSWQLDNRMISMHQRRFDFGFAIDLMRKDLRICLAQAEKEALDLPATEAVLADYDRLAEEFERGDCDTSALVTLYDGP